MKLFGTAGSPFVRKARLALEEKGVPYEYVLAPRESRATLVVPLNPLGKIPTLLSDDGKAVFDSPVIVEYVDGLKPEPRLIPAAFEERITVKRWEALGDGVAEATVLITHDVRKPADKREPEKWYEAQRVKIRRALALMEHDLGDKSFCFGSSFTLADIAAGYALSYLEEGVPDFGWRAANPKLARHYDKLNARESFRKTDPTKM
jgi:glutathione S-transferase